MLTLFAQNKGKISAQAKGSRKQTSPFLSCSQLFACGEYSFYQKGEKYFLSQCVIKKTFGRIMEDMDRYLLASFFAELTEKVLMENQANTKLFSLLINTLYQVEEEPLKFHELFCYFGMKMLDLLGSVSYTHLDVYKRHNLRLPPALSPNTMSIICIILSGLELWKISPEKHMLLTKIIP